MQIHFLSDVLIAAASLDLEVPGRPFSLWGVNCRFWSHLGCLGWKVTIFVHLGYRLALCVKKSTKTKALTLTTDKSPLRVSLSLRHTHIGLPYGLIYIFRRASRSLLYGSSPGLMALHSPRRSTSPLFCFPGWSCHCKGLFIPV